MPNPIRQQSNSISDYEWSNKLSNLNISKSDLNRLILDYLLVEGYSDAANKFSSESGLNLRDNKFDNISERTEVKNYIKSGDIIKSIELINEINPDILDQNPQLFFNLQLQHLIELIRLNETYKALSFAKDTLSHLATSIPSLLPSLELTLTLLAFNNDDNSTSNLAQAIDAPPHIRQLLSQSQRERIAHQVNSAILESQMLPKHPKLSTVLKLLSWGESNLSSRVNFPKYNPPTSTSINRNQQGNNNHPYNFNSSSNHTNSVGQFDEQMLT